MKRLSLNAAVLAAAQVGSQLIGLAMLVIVTRRIGPAYLGAYAFSYNVVAYVGLATVIGLPVLGMRDVSESVAGRRRVLVETATAMLLLALIFGGVLVAASPLIAPSAATRVLLPILAIKLVIDALTFYWYLQGEGRSVIVAGSQLVGQLAYVAVLLPLLGRGLNGARDYAFANLAGIAISGAIMFAFVTREIGMPFGRTNVERVRARIVRSTPFLWWLALTQIYYSTDLILVGYLGGDREAGLYAAASKLPLSAIGVAALWFTVSMPATARLKAEAQTDVIRSQTRIAATAAVAAGFPFVIIGPIFATDIVRTLFGAKFSSAGPALAILSASVAISMLQVVVTSVVIGAGRERPYVRAMALGAAANVLLNLALIPVIGIVGASVSTLVAESMVLAAGLRQLAPVIGRLQVRRRAVAESAAIAAVAALAAALLRHEAGFATAALGTVLVYGGVIAARTMRNPRWLGAWLGGA
jgi:O-antigen/teichoic acid export membrane protein